MIFDAEELTAIIKQYKRDPQKYHTSDVIDGSIKLAEVIASRFSNDGLYREDMIQVCLLRIPAVMEKFDPRQGHLHKYMTSVFRNTCISYIDREKAQGSVVDYDDVAYIAATADIYPEEQRLVLVELITFLRGRFPSIETDMLDAMAAIVYEKLIEEGKYSTKMLSVVLLEAFPSLNRNHAILFYRSCVVWLRAYYQEYTRLGEEPAGYEFTLLPELRSIVGDELYANVRLMLRGMNIVVPS